MISILDIILGIQTVIGPVGMEYKPFHISR
jgi:hypothetical protein